ncbi:hypothetical protein Salat_2958000 [Sesamum alatum]|uniref:CCHC-type domain-containing protein n=1 Tax=Sesamum alatum TaxID=300844 RepID=A0AAE1XJS6_9LAMI|nr:hypothetical protein Salat_2958000 [Sesamum alatum]
MTDQKDMKKSDGKGNNLSSPYYLHPSDHPGMNICPVVFKGDNYEEWARSMRNVPLPPLNRTYALIIQEERHRVLTRTRDVRTEAVSFVVQGPKSAPNSATNVVCKSCGKPGHEINSCFKIIGYPEWWSTGRGKGSGRGRNTNSMGRGKGTNVVANAAQTVNTSAAIGTSTVLTPQDKVSTVWTPQDNRFGYGQLAG